MPDAPSVVVLDVNETLSDTSPMPDRWEAVGAPGHLAARWFAEVLRDGFALAAAGGNRDFATIAQATARRLLVGVGLTGDVEDAVEEIMAGMTGLDVHPDVPDGIRALRADGCRVITLSNGAAAVAEGLLDRAGLRGEVEHVLSVQDAPGWKPAPEAYAYALEVCGVQPRDAMLVAVHPWDIHGAAAAGLRTAWVDRKGVTYPTYLAEPEIVARSLVELADAIHGRG